MNPLPLEIPADALNSETLQSLIESFILREGTDYGWQEVAHEIKVKQIQKQLATGKIKILFDAASESVTLVTELEWRKYLQSARTTEQK